jgi:hypothetical protein
MLFCIRIPFGKRETKRSNIFSAGKNIKSTHETPPQVEPENS